MGQKFQDLDRKFKAENDQLKTANAQQNKRLKELQLAVEKLQKDIKNLKEKEQFNK